MLTKSFFSTIALVIISLLSACTSPPEPTVTLAPNPLPTGTPTLTLTPTATFTATPTPVPILISITEYGGSGADELIGCLRAYGKENFVLYEDGLLINYFPYYYSAQLSQNEIDDLIHQIEETGFFDVEGTGELGEDDPIYDFEGENTIDSGWGSSINILGKEVIIEAPLWEYLVAPVKDTYEILHSYHHEDEVPYIPNRLGVFILTADEEYVTPENLVDVFSTTPINDQNTWPNELPPLSSYSEEYLVYFEHEDVDKLLVGFPNIPSYGVFYEDEIPYLVFVCFPER